MVSLCIATIRTAALASAAGVSPKEPLAPISSATLSTLTSLFGTTDQSSITSDIGTGIYFRASIGTITASSFALTSGISITAIRDEEKGIESPQAFVVTF